ncbi:MAG: hypothetical protein U9N83_03075, partial [Thermodesulfobacteriota bacterium]|nr:hypothetical protein [Thermodesulfobacteriota bacterium]
FLSFRRKPESSKFNGFWMPDQVRHDGFGTFYETININWIIKYSYKFKGMHKPLGLKIQDQILPIKRL